MQQAIGQTGWQAVKHLGGQIGSRRSDGAQSMPIGFASLCKRSCGNQSGVRSESYSVAPASHLWSACSSLLRMRSRSRWDGETWRQCWPAANALRTCSAGARSATGEPAAQVAAWAAAEPAGLPLSHSSASSRLLGALMVRGLRLPAARGSLEGEGGAVQPRSGRSEWVCCGCGTEGRSARCCN